MEKKFNSQEGFNYQQWLEALKKDSIKKFQGSSFTQTIFKNKAFKFFAFHFYSQVALNNGASANLPFKTLSLLGEKLSHPAYKDDVLKIINQNIIKYKGQFYKLDDSLYQKRVQKAIKNFQFTECQEVKTAA